LRSGKTRRRERIFIDKKARASIVHLFAYVAVVLVLLFVNAAVTPKVWWFYWVALGWGIGVALHLWCAFGKRRKRPRAAAQPASLQAATPRVSRSPTQTEPQLPLRPDPPKPPRKRAPRQKKPKA
jgi:hypothetical protein